MTQNNKLSNSSLDHVLGRLLSKLGNRIFFPEGIIVQTEQAVNAKIQATAGMAFEENGGIWSFSEMLNLLLPNLTAKETLVYAPVAGLPELRKVWKDHIKERNSSLNPDCISTPIVTSGLTHGVSTILHLCLDSEDTLISPDCYWENYQHISEVVIGAKIDEFPMFNKYDGFNIEGLKEKLDKKLKDKKKAVILFNFPNNPTGYSILQDEVDILKNLLLEYAEKGLPILTISDDAYFGLFYEKNIYQESLFSIFSQLHKNIFAVKIDGASKEILSWGLRVGFVTFGCKELPSEVCSLFQKKIVAYIRASVTSSSRLSQHIVLQTLKSSSILESIEKHRVSLQQRYECLKQSIKKVEKKFPNSSIKQVPANSGYFISFYVGNEENAQKIRKEILEKEDIALIAINDKIRFAYSCVSSDNIEKIIEVLYKYANEMIK